MPPLEHGPGAAASAGFDTRQLLEAFTVPAFVSGLDDRLLATNTPGRALLEANGNNVTWPPCSQVPGLREALERAKTGVTPPTLDEVRWPGSAHVQLRLAVCPIRSTDGRPAAVLLTAVDRSELARVRDENTTMQAEQARLLEAESVANEELRTLADELRMANEDLVRRIGQLAAAEDADTRKNQFLAMLAHELRNPLAAALNALHIIERLAGDDPQVRQAIRIADRQLRHEARLLDDLLDVSRIVLGKITLEARAVDLRDCVRAAIESMSFAAEQRALRMVVEVPDEPLVVTGDATRLEQCVANLVSNAVKFTPPGGCVTIRADRDQGQASVTVRDTGQGIASAMLDHIFELFTQGDTSQVRGQGGLGIGLTLSRRLAEMHGGTLGARSTGPGHGSEFELRLPLGAGPAGAQAAAPATARRQHRLLVVEDNRDARAALCAILQMLGHVVWHAPDGASAVRLAVEQSPDTVILDLGLPDMDGFEAAQRIRRRLGDRVRLVALSGYGDEENRRRAREAGIDAHLVKPVSPESLMETVDAL